MSYDRKTKAPRNAITALAASEKEITSILRHSINESKNYWQLHLLSTHSRGRKSSSVTSIIYSLIPQWCDLCHKKSLRLARPAPGPPR